MPFEQAVPRAVTRSIWILVGKKNFDGRRAFLLKELHERWPWTACAGKEIEYLAGARTIQCLTKPPGDWLIRVRALQDHLQRVEYFAPQEIWKPVLVVNLEKLESHLPSREPSPQPENSAPPRFVGLTTRRLPWPALRPASCPPAH